MQLPWTYFQAGAEAQQPKKAAVKCKLLPVPRCRAPGFPIKATTIAGAAAAAEPLPGAGCAMSASLAPATLGHGPAPRSPTHSTQGQTAAVIAPPWVHPSGRPCLRAPTWPSSMHGVLGLVPLFSCPPRDATEEQSQRGKRMHAIPTIIQLQEKPLGREK